MRNSIWNKRIPTLFGILLIIGGIGVTSFLARNTTLFTTRAGPTDVPQNVKVTNVSGSSFTVSYTTADTVLGSIVYGKTQSLSSTTVDQRDEKNGTIAPHNVHIFTISKLSPNSKYYFAIISGQTTYLENGKPYTVTTAPIIEGDIPFDMQITGNILSPDGSKVSEALIYTENPDLETTVTVSENGKYTLHINTMRTKDLSAYAVISPDTLFRILITNGSFSSHVLLNPEKTKEVPLVTMSKDYDFTAETIAASASASATLSPLPVFSTAVTPKTSQVVSLQIITPKKDQGLSDQRPQFKGTAAPNSSVQVIIHSDVIQTQITADSYGNWTYRPDTPLAPGMHTISILSRDASGILKTVTQTFVVFQSGTQVAEAATPSATLTQTPTPTASPSPTLTTPTPTVTAAVTQAPTEVVTAAPTALPTQTITPTPKTVKLPVTGDTSVMAAGIVGITTTFVGVLMLFLARGGPM